MKKQAYDQDLKEQLENIGGYILPMDNGRYYEIHGRDHLIYDEVPPNELDNAIRLAIEYIENYKPYTKEDIMKMDKVSSRKEIIKFADNLIKVSTGEPDQDYDIALFDKIVKQLKQDGFDASHKEFDKYQGVYINVSGVDTFWVAESFVRGKESPTTGNRPYSMALLIGSDGGTYSANYGDYFQLPDDYVFEGSRLVLTDRNGKETFIDDPKKSDFPKLEQVRTTIEYEGEPNTHIIFYPENYPDTQLEVIAYPDGKVDASELVEYCKSNSSFYDRWSRIIEKM